MDDNEIFRQCIGQAHEHILKAQAFILPLIRRLHIEDIPANLFDLKRHLRDAKCAVEVLEKIDHED